jgi:AraC-like DNA-binding protein
MAQKSGPFHHRRPAAPLSEHVDLLWSYAGVVARHAQERLLPTGTMELVFRLGADGRPASGIAGARSEFTLLDTSEPFSAVGVHFKPGGGFPFFGVPSDELHNDGAALDAVWGRSAASVVGRLWEANTAEERFQILERALIERLRRSPSGHPAVRYAVRCFDNSNGTCAVSHVVQRIGLSERRFVDLFRSEVGLSPKVFCRIRRFNEALTRIEHLTEVDWLDVALSCGYFDQAHFNHDFHAFSGINPSTYLRYRASRTHVALEARSPKPEA